MSFQDPILGGTVLRIPAEQSPNYVPGVSGWIIKQDGSAEFNNLSIRGTFNGTDFIIDSAGVFFYNGTPAAGNLQISLAATAGSDSFGNAYPQGLSINESSEGQASVVMGYTSGSPLIYFPDNITNIKDSAGILGTPFGSGTAQQDALTVIGPQDLTNPDTGAVQLVASSRDGTGHANVSLIYNDTAGVEHIYLKVDVNGVTITGIVNLSAELIQTFTADTTAMISQTNTTTTSNSGFISQVHFIAGSIVVKARVTGDTSSRYILTADGKSTWGPGNATQDTNLYRAAASVLKTDDTFEVGQSARVANNVVVGSLGTLGDNGVGEIQLANATTVPTTNPTGGGVLYDHQGVPTHRDPAGLTLGMVRFYAARATSQLSNFTTEADVPGATVNVVVTGSNASIQVTATWDCNAGGAACTQVGFFSWNGADQSAQGIHVAPTAGGRDTVAQTYTITGITAGTYVAKLRASCSVANNLNQVGGAHTGLSITLIDQ